MEQINVIVTPKAKQTISVTINGVAMSVVNSDGSYSTTHYSGTPFIIPDTIIKNTAGATILTQPSATSTGVISDSVVSNSDDSFVVNVPAEEPLELADITHIDTDLTPVVLPAMTPMVCTPAATPEGWYPPADWGWDAASALISDGSNGFVALLAVFPDITNRVALLPSFTGTGVINYGDGSGDISITSGVKAEHEFNYSSVPGSVTSSGYKVAIIKIVTSSYLQYVNCDQYHASDNSSVQYKWLACKMRSTSTSAPYYQNQVHSDTLEILDTDYVGCRGSVIAYACISVKRMYMTISKLTNSLVYAFWNTRFYFDWNNEDYTGKTDFSFAWQFYATQSYDLNISVPNATILSATFIYAKAFRKIKLSNTGNVNTIDYCLFQNFACESFMMDNCGNVSTTTNFVNNPGVLKELILTGLTVGINVSGQLLSATAINAFLTALGTANGAQTVNLAGNPGALTCDASIGTAKGYTVITA